MQRDKLRRIITETCDAVAMPDSPERDALIASADSIDKVVVGNYDAVIEGKTCGCPATVAGLFHPGHGGWTTSMREAHEFPAAFDSHFVNPRFAERSALRGRIRTVQLASAVEYVPVTD